MSRIIFSTVKVIAATTYTASLWKLDLACLSAHTVTKGGYFPRKGIHKIVIDFAASMILTWHLRGLWQIEN